MQNVTIRISLIVYRSPLFDASCVGPGIQGFARLCPGDVFEVTLKHGRQKWRSKGRVGRDGAQTWDNSRAVFKALLGEVVGAGGGRGCWVRWCVLRDVVGDGGGRGCWGDGEC